MKMAGGKAPRRFIDHTTTCNGDSHGMFTFTAEIADAPWPGLWTRHTCTHCGTKTWRNTKGEKRTA